jgi:hypothetical protein
MGILDNLYNRVVTDIASRVTTAMGKETITMREYRRGNQPKQLKVNKDKGQYDDNVTVNFVGLVINRSVSQMIGGGVEFRFDGEDGKVTTPQGDFVRACLDANKEEILFHRAALSASEAGTGYLFLMDKDTTYDETGAGYPRILVWDPALVSMKTLRNDFDIVIQYTHEYYVKDEQGKQSGYRKVVERDMESESDTWYIRDYEMAANDTKWVMVNEAGPYSFCRVIHWQNLPTIDSCYGDPDISYDMRSLQDRINGNASNVAKVIRLTAHPYKWGSGTKPAGDNLDIGPDHMPWLSADGAIHVEPPNDNTTGIGYLNWLRAVFFDTARTVDISSLADKLGSLTNFALRVIYQDNKNRIETKQELFGDALETLVYRLQIIGGLQPVHADVEWADFVPVDDLGVAQKDVQLVGAGIEDKQTAAEHQGLDWAKVSARLEEQAASETNVGALLLNNFNRGV